MRSPEVTKRFSAKGLTVMAAEHTKSNNRPVARSTWSFLIEKISPWGLFPLWLVQRGVLLGVRIAAFDEKGHVCLIRHTYLGGWHLPGGGVDRGEPIEHAAIRELKEESGLDPLDGLCFHSIHINRNFFSRDHICFYSVNVSRSSWEFEPNMEIADCQFFPLDALPPDLNRAGRQRLLERKNALSPDPYW